MISDLILTPKDTGKSCVFDYPDRPVRPIPPTGPGDTPIPDYPYEPTLDIPNIPTTDPTFPDPHGDPPLVPPPFPPYYIFANYLPYDLGGREVFTNESAFAYFQYWDINDYPTPYNPPEETGGIGLGWNGSNQFTMTGGEVVSYPVRGISGSPRAALDAIYPTETGKSWSEDYETGLLAISHINNLSPSLVAPNPTSYEAWFLWYAMSTFPPDYDDANPATWPKLAVAGIPIIQIRDGSGVTVDMVDYDVSRSYVMCDGLHHPPFRYMPIQKQVRTAHIVVPSDTVAFSIRLGYSR
jgi:hypothetical protein